MASSSSPSSSSNSDSDNDIPIPNTLRVATVPASPSVVHGINIQSRVPIVLDLDEANYTAWARAFSAVFGQYGLGDHVDGTVAPQGDSDWVQNDCAIVSWLYNRLATDILTAVSSNDDTAYSLWRGVRDIFHTNRSSRAVYVNSEFRSLIQGDMTVLAYCTRMKALADRLGNLGTPITNADLIQNIIRGLNPRLHHYVPHLTSRKRLPAFHKARSMLQTEELRLAESAKLQAASALIMQAHQRHSHTSGDTGGLPSTNTRSTSSPPPAKKKKKKTNTSSTSSSSTPRPPASSSASHGFSPNVNPWTGVVQAWPFPPAPRPGTGILGSKPASSTPQAHVANSSSSAATTTTMDPQLLAALTNLSLQQSSSGGDWFLDTGASSHMASGSGSQNEGSDTPQ
ncbi:unnamed protein product [Urochloa humidicola]